MKTILVNTVALIALLLTGCADGAGSFMGGSVQTIHSQPSFTLQNDQVDLAVTRLGGHMAPVTFYRGGEAPVQPYYISPWQDENLPSFPAPILVPLRGDFFCLPFGGNGAKFNAEKHPPHGEISGSNWTFISKETAAGVTTLTMTISPTVRPGKVTKKLSIIDGQNVVYSQNLIEGFAGNYPLGHHATLALPEKEGSVRIAVSPFRFGMIPPGYFSDPTGGEYQSFQPGQKFTDLAKVPMAWKGMADADGSSVPARLGFADLFQLVSERGEKLGGNPAWITATNTDARYVWFALKDPAILNSTVFWFENHGRHASPWKGRNRCIGLEDVTGCFADGLAASNAPNALTAEGVLTTVELRTDKPTSVNYIQGVAKVPANFQNVKTVEFAPGQITLVSTTGQRVTVPVRHEFIMSGKL